MYHYLTQAIYAPGTVPIILMLINKWKYGKRVIAIAAVALYLVLLLWNLTLLYVLGPTEQAGRLTAWLSPVICWLAFFPFCKYKDGRLLFTVATGHLYPGLIDILAASLVRRATLEGVLLRVALYTAAALAVFFLVRKPYQRMLNATSHGWLRMCALPIILWAMILFTFYIPPSRSAWVANNPLPALFTCLAVVLVYVELYYLTQMIQQRDRLNEGYAVLYTQMHQLEQQTARVLENDRENRTFRHDMRHFIRLMKASIDCSDTGAMRDVLRSMSTNLDELGAYRTIRGYTGDAMIDSILTTMAERAEAADVDISIHLQLPGALKMERAELAVVISNALENALNACLAVPEDSGVQRFIEVYSSGDTPQFYLQISNSYTGELEFDPLTGLPVSNRQHHGYGTQSIAAFAEKKGAVLQCEATGHVFTLSLLV